MRGKGGALDPVVSNVPTSCQDQSGAEATQACWPHVGCCRGCQQKPMAAATRAAEVGTRCCFTAALLSTLHTGLDTGVMLLRNSDWSREFVSDALAFLGDDAKQVRS